MKTPHHLFGWSALFASAVFTVLFLIMPDPASAAVTERSVYYTYDVAGRQLAAKFDSVGGSDGITNAYNGFGDLTSTTSSTSGTARTLTYVYDGAGRRTQVTYADGQAFTYAYDNLSRLSGVYEGVGTGTPLDTFSYGTNGLVASRSEMGGSNVAYGWDDGGRLTSQTDAFPGGTGNVGWTFGFNSASQIASESRTNDAYAWTGAVGVNRPYAVNGLNQYTSAGPASFTYDANGNLTGDGTWTYAYDVENRLVSATSGGVTTHLIYDPLGRLSQISGSAVSDRTFLYDGDALVAEYSSGGGMPSRYVHGSNAAADDPLAWYDFASGVLRLLHADHLGSIVAATNNGGSPLINTYDEYGIPGSANTGRFGYTGQIWLHEIGLNYYKARIYSPTLGRFLQTDRIGYQGGMNLYAYVESDPVNRSDPTGNCPTPDMKCPPRSVTQRIFPQQQRSQPLMMRSSSAPSRAAAPVTAAAEGKLKGSDMVGAVGTAQKSLGEAADVATKGRGGLGVTAVKGYGTAITIAGAAINAKEQIDSGKPADAAIANAGTRGVAVAGLGSAVAATAPLSDGASIAVGVVVSVAVDVFAGEKIGTTGQQIYQSLKNSIESHQGDGGGGW